MNVYETIKKLRKTKDFTQAEVAEQLGIAPSNYTMLEQGKTELTYSKMIKLAEIFGVSVVELLGEGASLVVVGGTEGAKELEALKHENKELKEKVELQKRMLALEESHKHITVRMVINHLACNVILYEFENREASSEYSFFISFMEDILWYFDTHADAGNLMIGLATSYYFDDKLAFEKLLAYYVEEYKKQFYRRQIEKEELKSLIEAHKLNYSEYLKDSPLEIKGRFGSVSFTLSEFMESHKDKIVFFENFYNGV